MAARVQTAVAGQIMPVQTSMRWRADLIEGPIHVLLQTDGLHQHARLSHAAARRICEPALTCLKICVMPSMVLHAMVEFDPGIERIRLVRRPSDRARIRQVNFGSAIFGHSMILQSLAGLPAFLVYFCTGLIAIV